MSCYEKQTLAWSRREPQKGPGLKGIIPLMCPALAAAWRVGWRELAQAREVDGSGRLADRLMGWED